MSELKTVLVDPELGANHHQDEPVVGIGILVGVVSFTALINVNFINKFLSGKLFGGPNGGRLLDAVLEVPKADAVIRNSAELVVLVVEDDLLVMWELPSKEELLGDEIIFENSVFHCN